MYTIFFYQVQYRYINLSSLTILVLEPTDRIHYFQVDYNLCQLFTFFPVISSTFFNLGGFFCHYAIFHFAQLFCERGSLDFDENFSAYLPFYAELSQEISFSFYAIVILFPSLMTTNLICPL